MVAVIGDETPYRSSSPAEDPADLSLWPNQTSRANSYSWLAQHHDSIGKMEPRVLVLNFQNRTPRAKLDKLVGDLIGALAEGSRYHGYAHSNAPAFLQYRLFKFVDLREQESTNADSSRFPSNPARPPASNWTTTPFSERTSPPLTA